MFKKGQMETSLKKREAIYKKVQTMWTDEVPTAPIFQGNLYVIAQKNVKGILLSPTLQFNYGPISRAK
jgi:ABC-type transport system substrate-binding protein